MTEPKAGEVWALMFAGSYTECPILQVAGEAVKVRWCVDKWMTLLEFSERALVRVGHLRERRGWRRLFGKWELVCD